MTKYAQVVIYDSSLDIDFTYTIPEKFDKQVRKGQVVVVPFRNTDKVGFVTSIDDVSYPDAKPIKRVVDICLPDALISTTHKLSFFYLTPSSIVLKETIPAAFSTFVSRLAWRRSISSKERKKIIDSLPSNAKRQKEVLFLLYEKGSLTYNYIKRKTGIKNLYNVVDTLIKKGYIYYLDREFKEVPCSYEGEGGESSIPPIEFPGGFSVHLLNDLAFFEKVNFYMKLWESLRDKGSVLFVFPNQKVLERTRESFDEVGYNALPYYSGLKKQIEREAWSCIQKGVKAPFFTLAKGPFLPIQNLLLIVMDEEGSLEYITKTDPIFHLRNVAIERARNENIPIILESAKPSLFSYKGLISGGYKKIVFSKDKKKRSKILPNVIILEKDNKSKELSSWLSYRISYMYRQKKKIFLFVNKRGYSSLVCKDCGHVFKCPKCDIPLIYFSKKRELRCPRCNYKMDIPDFCPSCGGYNLVPWGEGIERIESFVREIAPDARILMISKDKRPKDFLTSEDYDIIIGTSASFGYFDLSDIDFIGVLSIDNMLSSGTYHAAEDVFLLLSFLRINMRKSGEMIIETRYPEHRVFAAFSKDDPDSFYRREILFRKELFYPPFSNMIKFVVGAKVYDAARERLEAFKEFLKGVLIGEGEFFLDVTGPYFSHKEKDYYFWELLFKIEKYESCASLFKGAYTYFFKKDQTGDFKVRVEIDPDVI